MRHFLNGLVITNHIFQSTQFTEFGSISIRATTDLSILNTSVDVEVLAFTSARAIILTQYNTLIFCE